MALLPDATFGAHRGRRRGGVGGSGAGAAAAAARWRRRTRGKASSPPAGQCAPDRGEGRRMLTENESGMRAPAAAAVAAAVAGSGSDSRSDSCSGSRCWSRSSNNLAANSRLTYNGKTYYTLLLEACQKRQYYAAGECLGGNGGRPSPAPSPSWAPAASPCVR
ncbi:hypothetical protein PLESTM_000988500, partial [Pleodorina starrii]